MMQEGGTGRAGTGEFDRRDFSGIWFRAMATPVRPTAAIAVSDPRAARLH